MHHFIPKNVKAVFFDHDDTLVGTMNAKWKQHAYIAKTFYNKELFDDEIKLHWGKPLRELAGLLYGTSDIDEAMRHIGDLRHLYPKDLFASTIPTLQAIHASGRLIGIVTASVRFSLNYDLELHRIPTEIIDYIQTSDDTPYHKPDARVFDPAKAWLSARNIAAPEVLYVGDSLHDMRAALDAGFGFLGVETGLVSAAEFRAAGVSSISNLSSFEKSIL